ncbi:hypothetical protein ACSSS7_008433 [Eimeria intestinalis]
MTAVVTEVVCVDSAAAKESPDNEVGAASAMETQSRSCTRRSAAGLVVGAAALQSGGGRAGAGTPGIQDRVVGPGGLRSSPDMIPAEGLEAKLVVERKDLRGIFALYASLVKGARPPAWRRHVSDTELAKERQKPARLENKALVYFGLNSKPPERRA